MALFMDEKAQINAQEQFKKDLRFYDAWTFFRPRVSSVEVRAQPPRWTSLETKHLRASRTHRRANTPNRSTPSTESTHATELILPRHRCPLGSGGENRCDCMAGLAQPR